MDQLLLLQPQRFAGRLPPTESIAWSGFHMQKLAKHKSAEIWITDQIKQNTVFVSMATDTFELNWNISKQGRGDKKNLKQARQFEMQSNITYHSKYGPFAHAIQIERRDISTATQTRKHPFIICMGKRGRRTETNIRSLTMVLCIHSSGSNAQSYYRRPHNLGSSFWEYISKRCESKVSMSDVYPFLLLLELCKLIIYFGGSIIQDNGHSVAREHLLLLYTFPRQGGS